MNASELTFGIEIETTVPKTTVRRERMTIGSYHCGEQVPYLPQGWTAERDSSLRTPDKSNRFYACAKDVSLQNAAKRHQTFVIIWAYKRCFTSFDEPRNDASPVKYGTCECPLKDSNLRPTD